MEARVSSKIGVHFRSGKSEVVEHDLLRASLSCIIVPLPYAIALLSYPVVSPPYIVVPVEAENIFDLLGVVELCGGYSKSRSTRQLLVAYQGGDVQHD